MLEVSLEALRGSINTSRAILLPASECFENNNRIMATQIAHENLKDTVLEGFVKFIEIITKIFESKIIKQSRDLAHVESKLKQVKTDTMDVCRKAMDNFKHADEAVKHKASFKLNLIRRLVKLLS